MKCYVSKTLRLIEFDSWLTILKVKSVLYWFTTKEKHEIFLALFQLLVRVCRTWKLFVVCKRIIKRI